MVEDLWRRRVGLVKETVLKPLGLQMLLIYSDDPLNARAVRHLTDFDVYAMYALVILPAQGDVVLAFGLHHSAYLVRVKEVAKANYFKGTYAPGELCRQLLPESHPTAACRVGVVGGKCMMQRIDADIRKQLEDATFIDADQEFWRCLYSTLEPQAIQCLHRSAAIASRSVHGAAKFLGTFCEPRDIAAEVGLLARRHGADVLNRELIRISMAIGSPVPERLVLPQHCNSGKGNAIAIEIVPSYRGFRSMCSRTFLSAQTDREADALAQARRTHAEIRVLLQPGKAIDSILREARSIGGWADVNDGLRLLDMERGIDLSARGIGSSAQYPTDIRPGMAIAVKTQLSAGPLGTVHHGDTVLVTDHGADVITNQFDTM